MIFAPEHIAGHTTHARRGSIANAFRYGVDYVLIDPAVRSGPRLFSRNRFNLAAVHDRDHGGPRRAGQGAGWAHRVLETRGLPRAGYDRLLLLTQPRLMGYGFNPVSFWLALRRGELVAVIAEVNNTFGDRHSYLCANPGYAPIGPADRIEAAKIFHVSPFQKVAGGYTFGFLLAPDRIAITIAFRHGEEGLFATLAGPRRPLTSRSLLAAGFRRPAGALRTVALIHWQALKLWMKRAPFRPRPSPPEREVS